MFNDVINATILVVGLVGYGYYQNKNYQVSQIKITSSIQDKRGTIFYKNVGKPDDKQILSEQTIQLLNIIDKNMSSRHQIFEDNNQIKRRLFTDSL